MAAQVVPVVPVVPQTPMVVPEGQALAGLAARSPSPIRVPSTPQANALLGLLPRVLAETGTVVPAVMAVLQRLATGLSAAQVVSAAIVPLPVLASPQVAPVGPRATARAAMAVTLTEVMPRQVPIV
jgi:hypothetical protein